MTRESKENKIKYMKKNIGWGKISKYMMRGSKEKEIKYVKKQKKNTEKEKNKKTFDERK